MTHVPDISTLIVNYNGGDLISRVVGAVEPSAAGVEVEIIVWDNASSDGSADAVEATYAGVTVLRSAENIGFVRATNRQLGVARGRMVLLLNPDAIPEPGAIRHLYDVLQSRPAAGAAGPRLLLPDGSLDAACRRHAKTIETYVFRMTGMDRLFPRNPRFGRYNLTYLDPSVPCDVDALSGACMLVRREALESIGIWMDERFRMYCEDEDWCVRLRAAGWGIAYVPDAVVWHYKGNSSSTALRTRMRTTWEWHRSVALFHGKHLSPRYPAVLNGLVYASIAAVGALKLLRRLLPARRRMASHPGLAAPA